MKLYGKPEKKKVISNQYSLESLLKMDVNEIEALYLNNSISLEKYQQAILIISKYKNNQSEEEIYEDEEEEEEEEEEVSNSEEFENLIPENYPRRDKLNYGNYQTPKKIALIIIEDEDKSNYNASRFADLYPFRATKPLFRQITVDNINDVIKNPIKEDELIFLPEIGMAIAYHDESEIQSNSRINNGLQMVFSSPIRSVHNTDDNFGLVSFDNNPNQPPPTGNFTIINNFNQQEFLPAADEYNDDKSTISDKFNRMGESLNLDPEDLTYIESFFADQVDDAAIHSNKTTKNTTKRAKTSNDKSIKANWGINRINARETIYTGENVNIAILDSGIDLQHPDFNDTNINPFSFVEGNINDIYGHGTHCASIATGKNGVAPRANLIAIKVLNKAGKGNEFTLLLGILLALKKGAHVISFSIELENGDRGLTREPFDAIIKLANEKYNCHVVCAAGNDSVRPNPIKRISSPADSQFAISISAIDNKDKFYVRSNRAIGLHQSMNFTAPGVNIFAAQSQQTPNPNSSLYKTMSGTSMAAPFITGTIALIIDKINKNYGAKFITYDLIGEELERISNRKDDWSHKDAGEGIPNITNL